jgi:hypothetical protein
MATAPSPPNPTISPPTDAAGSASPGSNPVAAPSATIVPTHFPHRTTTAAPRHPFLDTAIQPLNTVPIELDSTPVSPVSRSGSWKTPGSIEQVTGADGKRILGDSAKKDDLVKERLRDPAVLAAPPEGPDAEDFEAVEEKERVVKEV